MAKMKTRLITAAFAAVLLLISKPARAQNFIAAPESLPGGKSYAQWSAEWWQWAWSIPLPINPILDTSGINCDINQSKSGPVWFLAGTSGSSATRNCVIPAGRMIFFPIINLGNDYPCLDLSPTPPRQKRNKDFQPGPGQSLEQFLTVGYGPYFGARQYIDHVTALSATLDGVPIQDLSLPPENSIYRATSPMFVFNGDRTLLSWDPCVGPGHKGVSDGYWIMLKPLSPGLHILSFSGTETFPSGSFTVSVTYNLTIL